MSETCCHRIFLSDAFGSDGGDFLMNLKAFFELRNNRIYFFIAAIALIFIGLLIRNSGLYVTVLSDEYVQSKISRLLPFSGSEVPEYLYMAIYRLTSICGDGFLTCARIFNALFFVSAAPFIYLIARKVASAKTATFIALLSLLGPINSYTAYYMPESLYFLGFWIFVWFLLRLSDSSNSKDWVTSGVIFGGLALIKPHALFFVPAIILYIVYITIKSEKITILLVVRNILLFVVSIIAIKFLVSYLLAGKAGMTFFGAKYAGYSSGAASTTSDYHKLIGFIASSIHSVVGNFLALCLMYGLPFALTIYMACKAIFSHTEAGINQKTAVLALLILANLVLVVAMFTTSTVGTSVYESIERIHMRYYNFIIPMFLIITASQLRLRSLNNEYKWKGLLLIVIGAPLLYAAYTRMLPYVPSLIDNPELLGFTFNTKVFYFLSSLSFFSLVLWAYSARLGAKVFIYIFMPLAVIFSTIAINKELRHQLVPNVFDKAGMFAKQYLTSDDISKTVVIGSDEARLFRSLFYLDNPKASLETVIDGAAISKFPADKEWALVIGDHSLPQNMPHKLVMNGFTLVHIIDTDNSVIDFKKSVWPGVIFSAKGLSSAEPWGTWSVGDIVCLEFSAPLPKKFKIYFSAHAFGPNVGKEFRMRVGDSVIKFTLGTTDEKKVIEFNNPKGSKVIFIDIPNPVSPKTLGMSDDGRDLGIGLTEIKIVSL